MQSCNQCPQVRSSFVSLVSKSHEEISKNRFEPKNLRIVAPTKALARDAQNSTFFRGSQLEVIGNPISSVYFNPRDQTAARKRLGISEADVVGVAIAEQLENPLKQIPQLLEVFFQATHDMAEKAVLILIGNNGKKIAAKHLSCIWLGPLNDQQIAETLPAADFLISASLSESAGMTVIEAAALGVPAIAIRNGGSEELIENENDGILVKDLNEMASAIRVAIRDRGRFQELGQRARNRAKRSRANLVSAEYLKLYDLLLADKEI
jgi:glycosyltransferase involved in cell wall biosynthesis